MTRPERPERPVDAGFPAVLRRNPGSVTDLLERVAGEPVDAAILAQCLSPASAGERVDLAGGNEVLHRAVLLRGRVTGRDYVYAETSIVPARIPPSVRHRLEQTRDPIGRVLSDHRLAVGREAMPGPARALQADSSIAPLLAAAVLTRRYRILLDAVPAFVIDEWFLETVAEVLGDNPGRLSRTSEPDV
ncbi:MAG: chorismate--pyruvate lyase family protein [Acidimicrobiales bacterium]